MAAQELNRQMTFAEFMEFLDENPPSEYTPQGNMIAPMGSLSKPYEYTAWLISQEFYDEMQKGISK